MATYYRTGVETYSIIGTADEKGSLEGRIPDGSTYFAVDENMFYTFYGGTWYETLPEAARLYHDDVGTDTKPIKLVGGVATVVANELAEDSKVVHLAGTETITGEKTFTSNPEVRGTVPMPRTVSTLPFTQGATKGVLSFKAMNASDAVTEYGTISLLHTASGTGERMELAISAKSPDTTHTATITTRAMADGTTFAMAPTYTADNSADGKIVTRSMLATTPTVVHTTGAETVAGVKTFTNPIIAKSGNMYNSFTIGSRGLSQTLVSRRYASDGETNDQSFVVGTTYSNATTNYLSMGVWSPRATIGDTSEAQAVASLTLKVGNDDKMELYLTADLRDGTHKSFSLAKFDGTAWHPAWESSR